MDDAESFGGSSGQQIGDHGTVTTTEASSWRSLLESKVAVREDTAQHVPQMGQRSLQLSAPALSVPLAETLAVTEEGMANGSSTQTTIAMTAPADRAAADMLAGMETVGSTGLLAESTRKEKDGTGAVTRLAGDLQERAGTSRKGGREVEDVAEEDVGVGGGAVFQRRWLTEPHVVEHPCLHKGYSAPYRRMVSHGVLPKPATVQLVGR